MNSLSLHKITIKYIDSTEIIIDVKDFTFYEGLNFIIGKNGCGKSTLLKALTSHEDVLVEGKISFNNNTLKNGVVGIVSQNPLNSITPELTFIENLIQSKSTFFDLVRPSILENKKEKQKVIEFINSFNFNFNTKELFNKESSKLSSGQQQLLAILMRVYRSGKILLLDECTANLDESNTNLIIETLMKISKKGIIILFVTHQWELLELKETKTYIIENKIIKQKS